MFARRARISVNASLAAVSLFLLGCGAPQPGTAASMGSADGGPAQTAADLSTLDSATSDQALAATADLAIAADSTHGRTVAMQKGCFYCHQSKDNPGEILSGQTVPLGATMVYGRNLTPDPDTGIGAWSAPQIVTALRTGVVPSGREMCWKMPRYSAMQIGDQDMTDLVAFLRALPPVRRSIPETVCPAAAVDAGRSADAGGLDGMGP